MARTWFLLLGILSLTARFNTLQAEECSIRKLFNGEDEKFCSKGLDIIYSDIGLVSCIYIPNCFDFSWSLSKVWEHPLVRYSKAQPGVKYVLIMVDSDAPSRWDPKYRYWRHWLLTDIPGWQLISGQDLTGIDISAYHRPSPPPGTGYHRYQFYLYEQPIGIQPYLLPEESPRSTWDFEAFVERTKLGKPLATTQFMAMSHIQ
ncbi:phosphatidylethanolamine binding protein 4 L homeolog precursor [Xenopus laevis]|uniref:MGC85346 protein n=1 Tax=Xenopus laevis TaxID=8355 RepID=Q66KX5_XENLA|nr:phosphatidylethanolamine binding protein 4 L homeolog precursor [Xenopus laevis]AAH78524.1 MGC85346 protein [Xenopus laevis]